MTTPFIQDPVKIVITILVAFLPAILYTIIVRYSEKYDREPWRSIGQAFLWGGTISVVLVILLRGYFIVYFKEEYPNIASDAQYMSLVFCCLITPILAELIKPIGLFMVRDEIMEAEDGLIYGSVIGLGFTATENLLFGLITLAPLYGLEMFVTVIFMRSMSVMFIHASTTALSCYGITRAMKVKHKSGRFYAFPLFLLAAIGIHALFNMIVFMDLFNFGDILFSLSSSLFFSIIFAFILIILIYHKIYKLDRIDGEELKKREAEEERYRESEAAYDSRGRGAPHPQERPAAWPTPTQRARPMRQPQGREPGFARGPPQRGARVGGQGPYPYDPPSGQRPPDRPDRFARAWPTQQPSRPPGQRPPVRRGPAYQDTDQYGRGPRGGYDEPYRREVPYDEHVDTSVGPGTRPAQQRPPGAIHQQPMGRPATPQERPPQRRASTPREERAPTQSGKVPALEAEDASAPPAPARKSAAKPPKIISSNTESTVSKKSAAKKDLPEDKVEYFEVEDETDDSDEADIEWES